MSEEVESARNAEILHEECGILDTYTIDVLILSCSGCGERIAIPVPQTEDYFCQYCGLEYKLE